MPVASQSLYRPRAITARRRRLKDGMLDVDDTS